jgi:hypothetical protein
MTDRKEGSDGTRRDIYPVATGGADYWSHHCHRHVMLEGELLIPPLISVVLRRLRSTKTKLVGLSGMLSGG